MSVSILSILLGLFYLCSVEAENPAFSNEFGYSNNENFERESKQDYKKEPEHEKVLKLLRKAKKLRENNYKRAFENVLPKNDSAKLKKLFEELLNEKADKNASYKTVEEVEVTDEFQDRNTEDKNTKPELDEIEMVIEHITSEVANNTSAKSLQETSKSSEMDKHSDSVKDETDRKLDVQENVNERTGQVEDAASEEVDLSQLADMAQDRMMGGYPLTQYGGTRIPHYRTTITRSGVLIRPTIFTIQTSAPMFSHAANSHWIQNREGGNYRQIFARQNEANQRESSKVLEDFKDMGANAYSLASNMQSLRQGNVDVFSLGNLQPFMESHPAFHHVERSRSIFKIHH